MNQPFQRQPMDRTAHRGRMTNLMVRGGDIAAQGALRQGDISAGVWSGIANIAAGTAANIFSPEAQLKRKEIASREADLVDKERARSRERNLDGLMQMIGEMPPDDAADVLDREGYRDEALKLRQQTKAKRDMILDDQRQKWEGAQQNLDQASRLMMSVTERSTPEAQAAQYAAVLPKVRELLGAEGATQLGVTDEFNPEAVAGAAEWTMTAAQRVNYRRQMMADAKTEAKTKEERLQWGATFLAGLQSDVDTQDEWEANNALAKALGVPQEAVDLFGPEFSPEAVAKAQKLAPPRKGPSEKLGDFEAFVRKIQERRGQPLTDQEMLRARAQWEAAGRAPKDPPAPKDQPDLPSLADIAAARETIESSYKRQIGPDASNELPSREQMAVAERWRANEIAKLNELERRVRRAGGGMAAMAGGQDPTKASPAERPPEQVQVPTAVRNQMTKGPGDYGPFPDGSMWRMQRDGRIVRVK